MGPVEIILSVLLPVWTVLCFVVGVSMERGEWSWVPSRHKSRRDLADEILGLRRQLERSRESEEKWFKVAKEYQEVYPEPPKAFGYTINEESDRVAHSMSH